MTPTPTPDDDLVRRLGDGDERALAELYDRHGPGVFGLARRLLREPSLAEEVTQTVFVRLWERPGRFDPSRASLRSYLLADVHGRSIDLIRSEEARRRRESADADRVTRAADAEAEAWSAIDAQAVRDAVNELPEDERAPIVLAYFGGHPYRAVADMLDTPEGTIKSRIRSGLRRLRGLVIEAGLVET